MRRMSATKLLLFLFLLLCGNARSVAGQETVFGPETFVRGTGPPQTITRTFSVQDTSGFFDLVIQNRGVTSAVIEFNGVKIASPSDFQQQTEQIVEGVSVVAQNTLSVELRGEPGTSLSFSITRAPKFTLFTHPSDPLFLRAELSNGDVYDYFGEKDSDGFATSFRSLSIRSANGRIDSYFFEEQSQTVEIHAFNGVTLKLQQQSATLLLATVTSADSLTQVTVPIDLSQQSRYGSPQCPRCTGSAAALSSQTLLHHSKALNFARLKPDFRLLGATQNNFQQACESAVRAIASVCHFVNIGLGIPGARTIICAAIASAVALVPGGVALVPTILAACQPVVLLGLQTACLLIQLGDVTGFSSYLCERIASVITTPRWQFLRFVEGDPRVPGDGILVSASGGRFPVNFDLNAPFSLAGSTDGITVTVFPPAGLVAQHVQLDFVKRGEPNFTLCSGGGGTSAFVRRRVRLNGVGGLTVYHPQEFLQTIVNGINQLTPSCNVTLENLEVRHLWVQPVGFPSTTTSNITTLDAAAMGNGPNAFPGTPLP